MTLEGFFVDLEEELVKLANKQFKTYRQAAYKDIKAYIRLSKSRLADYARLVETGQLTETDRAFLTAALEENATLYALKASGRTAVALKRFAGAMVDLSLQLLLTFVLKKGLQK